jgi:hypothetical protein
MATKKEDFKSRETKFKTKDDLNRIITVLSTKFLAEIGPNGERIFLEPSHVDEGYIAFDKRITPYAIFILAEVFGCPQWRVKTDGSNCLVWLNIEKLSRGAYYLSNMFSPFTFTISPMVKRRKAIEEEYGIKTYSNWSDSDRLIMSILLDELRE